MTTGIVLDPIYQQHVTSPGHPERSKRLAAIEARLQASGLLDECVPIPPSPIDHAWILENHSEEYVTRLREACESQSHYIDTPDSSICQASYGVAVQAAGALLSAVDQVMEQHLGNAFCAIRPPGHHCEWDHSMGFCLFNNIAIAARYLKKKWGLERVLILDWDVHHGNGTQHAFEDDPTVFFCSIHAHPSTLYPGSGWPEERGRGEGKGATLNLAMPPGSTDTAYQKVFKEKFLPAARDFRPDFILVSAGFDAHKRDPVGNINLESESFRWLTEESLALADEYCKGRVVSTLEGGYNLQALAESAELHLQSLLAASN